jgi:predicted alpha/beta-fold hydrolase
MPIPVDATPWQPGGALLAQLDRPGTEPARALVLLLHGLGGSSRRRGVRRLAAALLQRRLAVLRLNLRGAGPGRLHLAGTYAARCNEDLAGVLRWARRLATDLGPAPDRPVPLLGAGLSLGGTILMNACLDGRLAEVPGRPVLAALACASSPLDLAACSAAIERPRNRLYQQWLLARLVRQTLADPGRPADGAAAARLRAVRTIREFDAVVTAPRWGHGSVAAYYRRASPLPQLLARWAAPAGADRCGLPPLLLLQARDDPWVPAGAACRLGRLQGGGLHVVLPERGGHNGFHGPQGCWSDQLLADWLAGRC